MNPTAALAHEDWSLALARAALRVVARAEADGPQLDLLGQAARASVRYADPAAWTTATALERLLAGCEPRAASEREHIGIIVVSDDGPQEIMNVVAEAAKAGYSSPLRYAAANPGSLAGVSSIVHRLRGPTLVLIVPPERGVLPALVLSAGWLKKRHVPAVIVAAHTRLASGGQLARCLLLSASEGNDAVGSPLTEQDLAWLSLASVGAVTAP
jgi:hypothetical protein